MAEKYTGVEVIYTEDLTQVAELFKKKKLNTADIVTKKHLYPNMFVVFKGSDPEGLTTAPSALGVVSQNGQELVLLDPDVEASDIKPRNKEQVMALNMLLDDNVPLNIMTGRAGTGKTLMALAAALQKIEEGEYERLILTRPMSQVGRYDLGALPGGIDEKFMPYQTNFFSNFEQLVGKKASGDLVKQYGIEFIPMQLIRGASFFNCFIIADEVQVLDYHEMLTLGTRIGEGSKLVIMGDLNQRDEKIPKDKTGLYKIMEDKRMKESHLVSAIELLKVERSPLAKLFADVFEE